MNTASVQCEPKLLAFLTHDVTGLCVHYLKHMPRYMAF